MNDLEAAHTAFNRAAVDVSERLAVGVSHFTAARNLLHRPWRRKAAGPLLGHARRLHKRNGPRGSSRGHRAAKTYKEPIMWILVGSPGTKQSGDGS